MLDQSRINLWDYTCHAPCGECSGCGKTGLKSLYSTIITTQLPADHWSEVMGDEIIRDALIERLQPAANTITLQGPGYRSEAAKKLDKGAARK